VQPLARTLALNGTLLLTASMVAGLLLHRRLRAGHEDRGWHLVHASVSGRGVFLMALAGILPLVGLPAPQQALLVRLLLFFAWSSTAAMVLGAVMGVRGQRWDAPAANKVMYLVYVAGAVAVFPAMALLIAGLLRGTP